MNAATINHIEHEAVADDPLIMPNASGASSDRRSIAPRQAVTGDEDPYFLPTTSSPLDDDTQQQDAAARATIATTEENALEALEIELLLRGIYERYGFDFREYSPQSLKRRIWKCIHSENLQSISALQDKLFHDTPTWKRFLADVTVSVTSMFRDADYYLALRNIVIPRLAELEFIRV